MTYTGNEQNDVHGFNSVEMQVFRKDKIPQNYELYSIDFSSGKPRMSGPNPTECMECHKGNSPNIRPVKTYTKEELEKFITEKCQGKSEGYERYRLLNCDKLRETHAGDENPMKLFSRNFNKLTKFKFASVVMGFPNYAEIKYLLVQALAGCGTFGDGLPKTPAYDNTKLLENVNNLSPTPPAAGESPDGDYEFVKFQKRVYARLRYMLSPVPMEVADPNAEGQTKTATQDPYNWGISPGAVADSPEASTIEWIKQLAVFDPEIRALKIPTESLRAIGRVQKAPPTEANKKEQREFCLRAMFADRERRGDKTVMTDTKPPPGWVRPKGPPLHGTPPMEF